MVGLRGQGVDLGLWATTLRKYISNSINDITGPGGWPRTVGHDLKFESTGGKMMLAPHSARRVETRRAE